MTSKNFPRSEKFSHDQVTHFLLWPKFYFRLFSNNLILKSNLSQSKPIHFQFSNPKLKTEFKSTPRTCIFLPYPQMNITMKLISKLQFCCHYTPPVLYFFLVIDANYFYHIPHNIFLLMCYIFNIIFSICAK